MAQRWVRCWSQAQRERKKSAATPQGDLGAAPEQSVGQPWRRGGVGTRAPTVPHPVHCATQESADLRSGH